MNFENKWLQEQATALHGNTRPCNAKHRNFLLTINEQSLSHYNEISEYLKHYKSLNYLLTCEHIGQKNKHYHTFIQFKSPIKLNVNELFGSHIDVSRGTPQQNINYVKCEDEKHIRKNIKAKLIEEIGTVRKTGNPSINDVKQMTKEEREDLPLSYKNIVDKINEQETNDIDIDDWFKDVKVIYIVGPSGIGKTQKAKEIIRQYGYKKINVVKFDGNFWLGTGTADVAIYDDFRDSHMKASEFINFIDYNKQIMNIKGGKKLNEYKLIIITSIQHPKNIYRNISEAKKQWMRRIEIIDLNPKPETEDPNF